MGAGATPPGAAPVGRRPDRRDRFVLPQSATRVAGYRCVPAAVEAMGRVRRDAAGAVAVCPDSAPSSAADPRAGRLRRGWPDAARLAASGLWWRQRGRRSPGGVRWGRCVAVCPAAEEASAERWRGSYRSLRGGTGARAAPRHRRAGPHGGAGAVPGCAPQGVGFGRCPPGACQVSTATRTPSAPVAAVERTRREGRGGRHRVAPGRGGAAAPNGSGDRRRGARRRWRCRSPLPVVRCAGRNRHGTPRRSGTTTSVGERGSEGGRSNRLGGRPPVCRCAGKPGGRDRLARRVVGALPETPVVVGREVRAEAGCRRATRRRGFGVAQGRGGRLGRRCVEHGRDRPPRHLLGPTSEEGRHVRSAPWDRLELTKAERAPGTGCRRAYRLGSTGGIGARCGRARATEMKGERASQRSEERSEPGIDHGRGDEGRTSIAAE